MINIAGKVLKACAVKAPGFGDEQGDLLEDIALLTDSKVAKDKGGDLQNEGAESFGEATKVVITKNIKTTIIGGSRR